MKKITFLFLGLMMTVCVCASNEDYHPLVKDGRKWVYLKCEQISNSNTIRPLQLYSLDIRQIGDINQLGEVYLTLLDKNMDPVSESSIVALLIENESKRVVERYPVPDDWPTQPIEDFEWSDYSHGSPLWYSPEAGFYEIYDFSTSGYLPGSLNNIISYDDLYYLDLLRNINRQTTVEVGDDICNAYILNEGDFFFEAKVIEGIGIDSRSGDLLNPQPDDFPMSWAERPGLVAVYDGDELIYKGCLYDMASQFAEITTVADGKQVSGVKYYNLAGVECVEPQDGINIKVTTYSDGTRSSEKVVIH